MTALALSLASCSAVDDRAVPGTVTDTLPGDGSSEGPTSTMASPQDTVPTGVEARIEAVLDGDSIAVELDGNREEVRLVGINSPEATECYGDDARAAAQSLVGTDVVLLVEVGEDDRDRFGRLLRYVYAAGRFVNEEMVRGGHAIALQGDHDLEAAFKQLETTAFEEELGLWAAERCGPAPTGPAIVGVEYDAPGRDSENPNGEWIEIGNLGATPVDMSGWLIRDESSQHRYAFPDGFTLGPDVVAQVHSGCGTDDEDALFWCADDPVWTNGGDTAILQTASGTVVDRWTYPGAF